jgi:hypothetical protein
MKKLLLFTIAIGMVSCNQLRTDTKEYKFALVSYSGKGFNTTASTVKCDSFKMYGTKKADAWVDGSKINIEAENVITAYSKY